MQLNTSSWFSTSANVESLAAYRISALIKLNHTLILVELLFSANECVTLILYECSDSRICKCGMGNIQKLLHIDMDCFPVYFNPDNFWCNMYGNGCVKITPWIHIHSYISTSNISLFGMVMPNYSVLCLYCIFLYSTNPMKSPKPILLFLCDICVGCCPKTVT